MRKEIVEVNIYTKTDASIYIKDKDVVLPGSFIRCPSCNKEHDMTLSFTTQPILCGCGLNMCGIENSTGIQHMVIWKEDE